MELCPKSGETPLDTPLAESKSSSWYATTEGESCASPIDFPRPLSPSHVQRPRARRCTAHIPASSPLFYQKRLSPSQYDSGGGLVTQTAYDANGSGQYALTQATKYLYSSPIGGSLQSAEVAPDSTDSVSQTAATLDWSITSGSDHTSTTYDVAGETSTSTDQRYRFKTRLRCRL